MISIKLFHTQRRSHTVLLLLLRILLLCPLAASWTTLPCVVNHRQSFTSTKPTSTSLSFEIGFSEVALSVVAGFAGWLYIDGADDRARSNLRREEVARVEAYQAARAQKAYIEPKEWWTEEELRQYDGTQDDGDGPILLSANGLVLNVWKGRHFYGPGCEYALFAGRDCTRLLAKTRLEEETDEERAKPLTMAERAALAGWMWTMESKYEVVGKLEGFDPNSTKM